MYGPFFAYFNGFLLLICGSWFGYQILTYLILCIGAGTGMYFLARKAKANEIASVMVAVLYINIGSIQAWFDHTNLIAWGGMLLVMLNNKLVATVPHSLAFASVKLNSYGSLRNMIMIGLAILFTVQIIFALTRFKTNKLNFIVSIEGGIFFILSTCLINWQALSKAMPFLKSYLQFPHRLLIIAYPLLGLGIALSLTELSKYQAWQKVAYAGLAFVIFENVGANYSRIIQHTALNQSRVYTVKNAKSGENSQALHASHYNYVQDLKNKYRTFGVSNTEHGQVFVQTAARGLI
ncbi:MULTISPECIES: hypothetical protein [Lactobacillus]|uniref:hypothetical protein n=1 Tax=Lactobacillus TaxID=1578 RepID=UPI002493064E|nr:MULTISPECIES: hypothetical protein [Lactobacillus]